MDNDQDPINDQPVEQQQDTTDLNSNPSEEEVVPEAPPAPVQPIPPQPVVIQQTSFGRAYAEAPIVVTNVSN